MHINEDSLFFEEMPNVGSPRRMKLTVYEIGNMLASAIEEEFHIISLFTTQRIAVRRAVVSRVLTSKWLGSFWF